MTSVKRLNNRKGQALVEFALLLPFIMLVLIGLALFAFIREIFPIEVTAMALLAAVLLLGFIAREFQSTDPLSP